jgi:hypothetical protein
MYLAGASSLDLSCLSEIAYGCLGKRGSRAVYGVATKMWISRDPRYKKSKVIASSSLTTCLLML